MKKLGSALGILVGLGALYSGFWFYQAENVKKRVMNHIKPYQEVDEDGYHWNFSEVNLSGFPFNYEVVIKNPKHELAEGDPTKGEQVSLEGDLKIGTSIFGTSYWIKKEGPISILEKDGTKYVLKGDGQIDLQVFNPDYLKSFIDPFSSGFAKDFSSGNLSFEEITKQVKQLNIKKDKSSLSVQKNGKEQELLQIDKANMDLKNLGTDNLVKLAIDVNFKGLEANDKGDLLTSYFQDIMQQNPELALKLPYIIHSGKNDIGLTADMQYARNLSLFDMSSYKDFSFKIKDLYLSNVYGDNHFNMDVSVTEQKDKDSNIHLGLATAHEVSKEGMESGAKQFVESVKIQANDPENPKNALFKEILACCANNLKDVVPDYEKLGKMQFVIDSNIRIRDSNGIPGLLEVVVKDLNLTTKPYSILSHGDIHLEKSSLNGQYIINWTNYKNMLTDMMDYYNRVFPLLEKVVAFEKQQLPFSTFSALQKEEVIDFFKSLADNHDTDGQDLKITIDYNHLPDLKIGNHSFESVMEALNKLKADLQPKKPAVVAP